MSPNPRAVALSVAALVASCTPAPAPLPPHPCAAPARERADEMLPCNVGSGVFGTWGLDDGLPAYAYALDQRVDERAVWVLSDGVERRDHLFQIGNGRAIGVVDTDGFAQLFLKDRGPVFLNRVDRFAGRTGGGYSWVVDSAGAAGADAPWCTAFGLARDTTTIERTFGVQAATHTAVDGEVSVTHTLMAPAGDLPYLVDEVRIENLGAARSLRHVEVWDANRHALALQLLRSGTLSEAVPRDADAARDRLNASYTITAIADGDDAMRLRWTTTKNAPSDPEGPAPVDDHPDDIFLARLHDRGGAFWTQREAFFGRGGPSAPDALFAAPANDALAAQSAAGAPGVLADDVTLELGEGEVVVLRWAFGAIARDAAIEAAVAPVAADVDVRAAVTARERAHTPFFVVAGAIPLHREMAWHAAQLRGAVAYDASYDAHHTVQGSTYQYLHGLDGAARDYALFAVPLAYLDPELAKENLRMIMRMTYADTNQISYATTGFGMNEDAVVHTAPSDLDLFFLWALAEYVVATGDRAFLDEQNPYWPRGAAPQETTREHARRAARHLIDDVGLGEHGLLRVGTGDWSDGIVFQASDRARAIAEGESVPNSQMATWVLPVAAAALFPEDDVLADELRTFAGALRVELTEEITASGWFRRAWFGADEPHGDDAIDLEAQVWGLIGEADAPETADLVFSILDEPSAVGAPLTEGNDVWHAITGLLTWGYTRSSPERAWRSFTNDTMTAYTRANPAQWYGIWSGPDGIGPDGGTWSSPATPMTDWPVMNGNQHAMPLLAMLRVAGIEPGDDGALHVRAPSVPGAFTLDLPILRLDVDAEGKASGAVRLANDGEVVLVVGDRRVVARGLAGDVVPF